MDGSMSNALPIELEPIKVESQLPFSIRIQEAAMGHLIREEAFLRRAIGIVHYEWFADKALKEIWHALVAFYNTRGRCPILLIHPTTGAFAVEEFKLVSFGHMAHTQEKEELFNRIDLCLFASKVVALDIIQEQCTLWLQATLIRESSNNLEKYYRDANVPGAMTYVHEKFPQILEANFEPDTQETFIDTRKDIMEKYVMDSTNACTTGCKRFDRAILSSNDENAGGLMVGDLTVVMAPISKGKTSFLITVAIQNVLKGKDVLLLVHEDILNIKRRVMMCATKCPANELVARYKNEESFKLIQEWEDRLQKHLVFIPMDKPGGTYIEDVVAVVQEQQKEWKRRHGKGFDLLVDDFPAKLLTRNRKKDEFRNQMYFIYAQFASLAASERFHALTAVQSNRTGAQANLEGTRALGMEDTAEAFGIPQIAHNFITINRSEVDREKKVVHYHIAKCRGEDTGKTVTCESRFDFYQTHGDDIGTCTVESGWTKAIKETAAGSVDPNGKKIPNDNEVLSTNGKLVARREAANKTGADLAAENAAKAAAKLLNENAAACSMGPDDGDPGPGSSVS